MKGAFCVNSLPSEFNVRDDDDIPSYIWLLETAWIAFSFVIYYGLCWLGFSCLLSLIIAFIWFMFCTTGSSVFRAVRQSKINGEQRAVLTQYEVANRLGEKLMESPHGVILDLWNIHYPTSELRLIGNEYGERIYELMLKPELPEINHQEAISRWENEGGATVPPKEGKTT